MILKISKLTNRMLKYSNKMKNNIVFADAVCYFFMVKENRYFFCIVYLSLYSISIDLGLLPISKINLFTRSIILQ